MTILFVDGFDHYATADILKKWNTAGSTTTIESTSGRRGSGCLRSRSSFPNAVKNLPATTSFVIGFAFNPNDISAGPWALATLLDNGTAQCSLVVNTAGTLSVVRGTATAVTNGTSVAVIPVGSFCYIEWKVTISDVIAENSCQVRINGSTVITVDAGQDMKATANSTANQLRLGTTSSMSTRNHDFDDLYVCDQSGVINNDFLGDVRIDPIYPNGAGTHQSWTPSTGVDHYAVVDETVPNTTDYLTGGVAGTKETNALQNISVNGNILGIQVNNAFSKTDAGACTVKNLIKSGSSEESSSVASPSTSYLYTSSVHELDPATGAAWLTAAVNALEAGAEVVS